MPRNLKKKERKKILFLHEQGLNISQISQELNITRSTVRRWIRRDAVGGSTDDRPRARRPRMLTQDQVAHMVNVYRKEPFITTTASFAAKYGCSTQTIRKALNRAGVRYIRKDGSNGGPARKKKLTNEVNSLQNEEEAESSEIEMLSDGQLDITSHSESSEMLSDSQLDITTSLSPDDSDTSKSFLVKKRHLNATKTELPGALAPLKNIAKVINTPREDEVPFVSVNVAAQPSETEMHSDIQLDITKSLSPDTLDTSKQFGANERHLDVTKSELPGVLDPLENITTIINTQREDDVPFFSVNVAAQPSETEMHSDMQLDITKSLSPDTLDTSKQFGANERHLDVTKSELPGFLDPLENIATIINTQREDDVPFFSMNVAAQPSETEMLRGSQLDIRTSSFPDATNTSKQFCANERHLDVTTTEMPGVLDPFENIATIINTARKDEVPFFSVNVAAQPSEIKMLRGSQLDITTSSFPVATDTSKQFLAKKRHLNATESALSRVLEPLQNIATVINTSEEDEFPFFGMNIKAKPSKISKLPGSRLDITTSLFPDTSYTSNPCRAKKRHLDATDSEFSGVLDQLENISTIINSSKEDEIPFFGMNVKAKPSEIVMLPDSRLDITTSIPNTSYTSKPWSAKKRHLDATESEFSGVLDRLENIATIINTPREDEDEFHFFGMNVAAQLRRLPLNVAMQLEAEFQNKLYLARVRLQNTGSSTTNSVSMAPQSTGTDLLETSVKEEVTEFQPDLQQRINLQFESDLSDY